MGLTKKVIFVLRFKHYTIKFKKIIQSKEIILIVTFPGHVTA